MIYRQVLSSILLVFFLGIRGSHTCTMNSAGCFIAARGTGSVLCSGGGTPETACLHFSLPII